MAKYTADIALDQACDYMKNNITELYVCPSQPADRAAAVSSKLASKTGLTAGSFTGPVDGTTSGRKLTKNAESGVSITGAGTMTHIALCSGTTLLSVVTTNSKALEVGDKLDIPEFRVIEIADVTP